MRKTTQEDKVLKKRDCSNQEKQRRNETKGSIKQEGQRRHNTTNKQANKQKSPTETSRIQEELIAETKVNANIPWREINCYKNETK